MVTVQAERGVAGGELTRNPVMGTPCNAASNAASAADRRESVRQKVIKSAKLVFDGNRTVYDCLVLDESAGGALIDLGVMITIPDHMTIQFSTGARYPAERRWAAGTKAGLRFTGTQIVTEDVAQRMRKTADIINEQGLPIAMRVMRSARFFDNLELRRLAEAAEAAYLRLELTLAGKIIT